MEQAYGVGSQVGMLPLVEIMKLRRIRINLMAIAGYNQKKQLVSRMANSNGEAPPEFQYTPVRCIENC
jgi:hypothetical protein